MTTMSPEQRPTARSKFMVVPTRCRFTAMSTGNAAVPAKASTIFSVPSVEWSSLTISSSGSRDWVAMLLSWRDRKRSPL